MRVLAISGFATLLAVSTVYAEPTAPPAVPAAPAATAAPAPATTQAAPAQVSANTAAALKEAAAKTSKDIAEVKAMFHEIYADVHKNTSPNARQIIAMGTGAGLGFIASGFIMSAWVAPIAASLSSGLGFSEAATGLVTASVTTVGVMSGTYAGSVYARDLVSN